MSSSHGNQKVSDQEIIEAIKSVDEPVASASEIATQVSLTRTGVTNRLNKLREQGLVERKDVGNGYVWWVSD